MSHLASYHRLKDSLENDKSTEEDLSLRRIGSRNTKSRNLFLFIALSLLLTTSIAFNAVLLLTRHDNHENLDELCARHTIQFSTPILNDVQIKYETVHFNGSFFNETIYRREPSPEVDKAWQDLGVNYRFVIVPEDEAKEYGIPAGHVKRAANEGGGFFANVEGLHHLHCLNMLRQTLWFNYDYYHDQKLGPFGNSNAVVKYHIGHCLDILRQEIMCQANIQVLSQVWINKETPFPDFNTEHKCRNFEDIRRWAEVRQVSEESLAQFYPGDEILGDFP